MTTARPPKSRKSFKCICGQRHVFGVYVWAHWDLPLLHTCPRCGAIHNILRGKVTLDPTSPVEGK